MRTSILPTLLLTSVLASSHALAGRSEDALALDNVHVVEIEQNRTSAPKCVRVEGKRLIRIDDVGSVSCQREARVVDLERRYVMPGLVDMHAHITLGPMQIRRDGGSATMFTEASDAVAEHNGRRLVGFGVTTVRNPGGDLAAARRYKTKVEQGSVVGPETFSAGPVINDADLPGLATAARSPEEMKRVVREQVEAGADWIKLYTGLSPELLKVGIDEAHRNGRPAVAHLEAVAWPDALKMGLDGIVHLMPISPDLLDPDARKAWKAASRGGTYSFFEWWEHFDPDGPAADRLVASFQRYRPVFDATLVAFHAAFVQDQDNPYKDDARRYAHPSLLANWNDWFTFAAGWKAQDFVRARAIWPRIQRMAVRLYATNARTTIGTDMSNPWIAPGISLHREMQLLSDAGVPTQRILLSATRNAADALGQRKRLGRIAAGYEADLVVLDADPLGDIRNAGAIHAVVLDGQLLDAAALDKLKGDHP